MAEAVAEQIGPYRSREVDLSTAINRIPPHDRGSGLPRPGLPNYADQKTWDFVVGTARALRGDDPGYENYFATIPTTYADFMQTTAGRHFAGEAAREVVSQDEVGRNILGALSRATLDLVGTVPTGIGLTITEDTRTGEPVAFLTVDDLGAPRDVLNRTDTPYQMRRLAEVLQDPNDRYWQVLTEREIVTPVDQAALDQVRNSILDTRIVTPGAIYTNPKLRGQHLGSQLAEVGYKGAIVAAMTNQATDLLVQRGLAEHRTILAPGIDLETDVSANERLLFLTLQIIPISFYERQYKTFVETNNPNAADFAAFSDIRNVADGRFVFFGSQKMPFNPEEQRSALASGAKKSRSSERETRLLTVEGIEKMQYPIISVPTRILAPIN